MNKENNNNNISSNCGFLYKHLKRENKSSQKKRAKYDYSKQNILFLANQKNLKPEKEEKFHSENKNNFFYTKFLFLLKQKTSNQILLHIC